MTPARMVHIGRYLVLVLMAVAVLLPFVSIVLAALHPTGAQISGLSVPQTWSWANFAEAWQVANFREARNHPVAVMGRCR